MSVRVAVATKHGKLSQIAPAFAEFKDWQLELAPIDTDEFGTFTGEVERIRSPRETAIEKAKAGARFLGLDYGIASEGTIGSHPHLPFITSDYELMAFVCLSEDLAIVESYLSADIVASSQDLRTTTELDDLFRRLDLPNHAVNIFVETKTGRQVHKGIMDVEVARKIIEEQLHGGSAKVRVENDFRAMNSPSRQANIAICAKRLAQRLERTCPRCSRFGWGRVGYEYGLPCDSCGLISENIANSQRLGCISCDYVELNHLGRLSIEPSRCEFCNP